ncbi:MAG: hypothetical protein ACI9TY_000585, partial [Alphaproteobacteria bacterium]
MQRLSNKVKVRDIMRFLTLLGVVLLGATISMEAYAQQRFFTLSGGSRGDTANAKHESQISELGSRADARDGCGASGMLYGKGGDGTRHAKNNGSGCIEGFKIDADGHVAITGDAIVDGNVVIGGKNVQSHALSEALTCSDNEKLTWSGSTWSCNLEADPKVGTLSTGKWCAESGGQIVCNQDKPSNDLEMDLALDDALVNGVRDFARKDGTLASCQGGEILIADGSTLKCVSLDTVAAGTLVLDDLSDVNTGLPSTEDLLYFNGSSWTSGKIVETFAKAPVDALTAGRCQLGEVITYDGDQLVCVSDIGGPGDSLILDDMADVSGTSSATATNIMTFDGQYWKADAERDLTVSDWAKIANPIANLTSGQCEAGYILSYDGTQLICVADAGGLADPTSITEMSDVSITGAVNNEILAYQSGVWVNQTETDPNVQAFARTANPIPTCAADNILTSDGTSLSCVADAGSAADGISLDDLSDVSITTPANHDMVIYDGTGFVNKGSAVCAGGEVLTYNGTIFSCVNVASSGLWTNNTTYISRGSAHVVNDAQALPAALTGAGTRQVWYPNKYAFRAGEVTGAEWDDVNIGGRSTAFGYNTVAAGYASFAAGASNNATGDRSVAMGGGYGTASGDSSIALGLSTSSFDITRDNVMGIIGGSVGIGTVNPGAALEVSGTIIISNGGEVCNAALEGAIRYISGSIEICDGTSWSGISAGSVDWYSITSMPTGVTDISNTALTTAELQQLQNIDATTISATQFGYLGAMDQGVATTDSVTFADVSSTGTLNISGASNLNTLITSGDSTIGGTLTVVGSLNVSGTQTIDGVIFAGGGMEAAGNISATTFTGDGSLLTDVTASSADWYGLTNIPTGVDAISNTALDTAELQQLQNIDGTIIGATQFGYLGAMDQSVSTTSDVTFAHITANDVSVTGDVSVIGRFDVADISATGTIQANAFIGDGSGLTDVVATSITIGLNDLTDAINDESSLFMGTNAGMNDNGTFNSNTGVGGYVL